MAPNPDYPIAQHHALVPNDVPWYVLAATITIGTALLAFGIGQTMKRWADIAKLPPSAAIFGESVGIALAVVGGAFTGLLVWNWGLGLCCGMVGGWCAPIVLRLAWRIYERR